MHFIGLWLLQQGHCTLDATWICVSALLPWLVVNPTQMQEPLEIATKIIPLANKATTNPSILSPLLHNALFPVVASADPRIITTIHLAKYVNLI